MPMDVDVSTWPSGGAPVSQGALTDRSGTIASGGTANTAIAANSARRYFLLQNLSNTVLWVNFGVTAVQDQPSIALKACGTAGDGTGGAIVFEGSFVPTGSISIIGPTTGSKFSCKEG
jgi:hypothetical protein